MTGKKNLWTLRHTAPFWSPLVLPTTISFPQRELKRFWAGIQTKYVYLLIWGQNQGNAISITQTEILRYTHTHMYISIYIYIYIYISVYVYLCSDKFLRIKNSNIKQEEPNIIENKITRHYPAYDNKLHLMVRLQFCKSGRFIVHLYYYARFTLPGMVVSVWVLSMSQRYLFEIICIRLEYLIQYKLFVLRIVSWSYDCLHMIIIISYSKSCIIVW